MLNLLFADSLSASLAWKNPRNPLKKLATVRINNGQHVADLVRECDPSSAIVEHRIRKSGYVHERLHAAKKLANELYDAAKKFRTDFERAQLSKLRSPRSLQNACWKTGNVR
jgi:hypothetical protein